MQICPFQETRRNDAIGRVSFGSPGSEMNA